MSASSSSAALPEAMPSSHAADLRFGELATEAQLTRTVAALERNGITPVLADSREGAVRLVLDLVPPGAEVLDASSQTLAALGLTESLADPTRFRNLRPQLARLREENASDAQRRLGAAPDVVVGSVHAITEKGEVVIASASGSQLSAYAFGAGKVVWVAGTQKIVPDLDAAFERIQEYTLPRESERARKVYGAPSFVGKLLVVHREPVPGRIHLVLLRENLGF